MKTSNINNVEPFINRSQLEAIEKRLALVPNTQLFCDNDAIYSEELGIFVNVFRIGAIPFYMNCIHDMNCLVEHVKNADTENDRIKTENTQLIDKISKLKQEIALLKSQNNDYENGGWVCDY